MRAFLPLLLLLAACSKPGGAPTLPAAALPPVSAEQSRALLSAIRSGAAPGPGQEAPAPPACEDILARHPDFTPGTLVLPKDWSQPLGAQIKVFYYWRRGTDDKRVPVVFFNGGPAESSHGAVDALADLAVAKKSTFVFLDQRGTGCSSPFPDVSDAASAARLMNWGSESIVRDAEALRARLFGKRPWRAFGRATAA